ncbi:MAG: hypothetical protein ACXIVO_02590 [Glycocaulis sp.]
MPKMFPWKGNFRDIPTSVREKLSELDCDLIQVAAAKTVTRDEVARGQYRHVGLHLNGDRIMASGAVLPPPAAGKWSTRNQSGWERVRKDWPKVQKTYYQEMPIYGDGPRNGYFMMSRTRDVWQHQTFEPQGMMIEPTILQEGGDGKVTIRFSLSPILHRDHDEFDLMLLWSLNVLQENTGVADVFSSDASREDYLSTITLDWEIFPPGSVEEVLDRLSKRSRYKAEFDGLIQERVEFFSSFEPQVYLRGHGGFGSYFGAKFADDLVVFENLRYGNAVYVLYDDWEVASRRSRLELLRDQDAKFDRVTHVGDWKGQLAALLGDKLAERGLRRRRSTRRYRKRR